MKLTGWYSADQKPVRIGWYQRWFTDGLYYHYWDGEFWRANVSAGPHWRQLNDTPYPVWRGLAEPLKGQV